jgi:hypothetical protein
MARSMGAIEEVISRRLLSSKPTLLNIIKTDLDVVQSILMLTSQYFHWHLGSDLTEEEFEASSRPSAVQWHQFTRMALHARIFWGDFGRGFDLLSEHVERFSGGLTTQNERAQQHAWQAFNDHCEQAETVFSEQHRACSG